ncbi:MAG: chaperone NapD [Thiobacillaceae bacterium]|nr:chaperone NapD [Thiobacillaceae bacterium]MDW8324261.1 chaperone NapD [Burkholderiales bacterium]
MHCLGAQMNLSGILVVTRPQHLQEVTTALAALPGVEVHQVDEPTGRIVVVQEAPDVQAEVDGLERMQRLPHVLLATMVYHYFGDETEAAEAPTDPVPAFLQD